MSVPSAPPDPATLPRPWMEAYPPAVPHDYRFPAVALPRLLDDACRDFPELPACGTAWGAIDHRGMQRHVTELSHALEGAGVVGGSRVLVGLGGGASLPIAAFAVWRLAAVLVPVRADLPEPELHALVADVEAVAVLGPRRFTRAVAAAAGAPDAAVVLEDDDWLRPPGRVERLRRRVTRTTGTTGPQQAPAEPPPPVAGDPALITFTSRAEEGRPTGVVWTHASLVAAAFQARLWVPDIQAGAECVLLAGQVAGPTGPTMLVLGPLLAALSGASVVCLDEPGPGELAHRIEVHAPSLLVVGTDQVEQLLSSEAARRDLTSLRVVLAVGGSLDPRRAAELERRTGGARVRACLGVEGAALTHAQPVYGRSVDQAVGLPVTGTVAVAVDPDHLDERCPPQRAGRLLVHGPQVAAGYWRRPERTERRFVDGWFVSDLLVDVDTTGALHLVGDLREMVASERGWLSLRAVEQVLEQHPAVRRAGAVPGERQGSLVAAVVCSRRGRPTGEELLAHCRAHLDSRSVPEAVILLDELPETDAGELARHELRDVLAGRGRT